MVVAASTLAVDTRAESAFDAPKRFVACIGILIGGALAFWSFDWRWSLRDDRRDASVRILAGIAVVGCCASVLLSPRPGQALEGLRPLVLGCFLVALGASKALEEGGGFKIAAAFLIGCLVNGATTLLQVGGLHLFDVQGAAGRADTGAFLGNDGYVGLLLALGTVLALGILATARSVPLRAAGGFASLLFLAGIAVNRSVTAFLCVVAGGLVVFMGRYRRRALIPLLLLALALTSAVGIWPPLRMRAREVASDAFSGDWEAVASHRLGPWAAAIEMVRERPLLGFGPGTFAAEYVPHRLAAEVRYRTRFVNPYLPGDAYAEVHNDLLQSVAEIGVPAGLALAALVALAPVRLLRRIRASGPHGSESLILLSFIVAGAAAAVTWFPFHRAFSAVPLLLGVGRAYRVSSSS